MPAFDPTKDIPKKKNTPVLVVAVLLLVGVAVYLYLGKQLGPLGVIFNPVETTTSTAIFPAPVDVESVALKHTPLTPHFFHEKLVYCDSNFKVQIKTDVKSDDIKSVGHFCDGLARVVLHPNSKGTIYINEEGKVVIPANDKLEYSGAFSEGLAAAVSKESKLMGFIDKQGKFAIQPKYYGSHYFLTPAIKLQDNLVDSIFSDGLCPVYTVKPEIPELTFSCVYIDKHGKVVSASKYLEGRPFVEGRALVCIKDDSKWRYRWGFIDTNCKPICKPIYISAKNYSEGLAAVLDLKGSWRYIDRNGKFAFKPEFSNAENFAEGFAAAATLGDDHKHKWGYISKEGEWLVKPRFDKAGAFHGGEARACNGCNVLPSPGSEIEQESKSIEQFSISADGTVVKLKKSDN
ncbi:MAG: WG repeat-containing protein [Candidatus Obscuribacterales bacterium]|nr:WG repeat-containing protein [Candidatus Obscuribacterales bacterium]